MDNNETKSQNTKQKPTKQKPTNKIVPNQTEENEDRITEENVGDKTTENNLQDQPVQTEVEEEEFEELENFENIRPKAGDDKALRDFRSVVNNEDVKRWPWMRFEATDKNDKKITVYHSKAGVMREKLKREPTVRMLIPRVDGESKSIQQSIGLNGYKLELPKNTYVDLPMSIANVIRNSQKQVEDAYEEMEAKHGVDRTDNHAQALN